MMVEKSTFKTTTKKTKPQEKLTRIIQSLNSKKLKEFLEDKNRSEKKWKDIPCSRRGQFKIIRFPALSQLTSMQAQ